MSGPEGSALPPGHEPQGVAAAGRVGAALASPRSRTAGCPGSVRPQQHLGQEAPSESMAAGLQDASPLPLHPSSRECTSNPSCLGQSPTISLHPHPPGQVTMWFQIGSGLQLRVGRAQLRREGDLGQLFSRTGLEHTPDGSNMDSSENNCAD